VLRAVVRLEIDPDPLAPASADPMGPKTTKVEPGPWDRLFSGSERMRSVAAAVHAAARSDRPVLIEGETGTGKELVAQALHALSRRSAGPLVTVRCSALSEDLVELELFGYQGRGRHDAARFAPGKLELARGGSLMLDDVGNMPLDFQAKLLLVIDEGAWVRPGGWGRVASDARIIAVTRRDLARLTIECRFSELLYARLTAEHIVIPPLRERREEIPALAESFRDSFCRDFRTDRAPFALGTIELMVRYPWPGNVRELENFVKRYVVLGDEPSLQETLRRA
jgi:DNA-binding NtrC family response regulator